MTRIITTLVIALFVFVGCGGETSSTDSPTATDATATDAPSATETSSDGVQEVVIQPVGDQLKYAQEEFTVKAGAQVKLVMDNIATLEAMQHNIVILAPGTDINTVGVAAMQAGPENDYVPADDESVLFYTAIAKPGEKTMVEFTAPTEPGEYPFICTFPGHYSLMKGVMIVA